jgi:hypothetical protein
MIKRYDIDIPNSGYITECEDGEFVSAYDHDRVVEKLKAEIAEAYNKGYDEGRWVGYHELSQDFGVTEKLEQVPYEQYYGKE